MISVRNNFYDWKKMWWEKKLYTSLVMKKNIDEKNGYQKKL